MVYWTVRNDAGRSKFKLTHNGLDRQPLSAKPIGNNGQLSLSNAATLADVTLSSNNVGRIMAFKGLFAVQWRDAFLCLYVKSWRDGEVFIRVSLEANERIGLFCTYLTRATFDTWRWKLTHMKMQYIQYKIQFQRYLRRLLTNYK